MNEPFSISKEDRGDYIQLSLAGAFASVGFAHLREAMNDILSITDGRNRWLILDLSRTTLLTSSCLEAIYLAKQKGATNAWQCAIVAPGADIKELFTLTGFDRFIPVYESLENFLDSNNIK